MRVAKLLTIVTIFVIFSNPAFAQLEKPEDLPLIAKPNFVLANIDKLAVLIIPTPSEVNTEGLVWEQLTAKVLTKLNKVEINIVGGAGNILEVPELRLYIDMLEIRDSQQYVIRVQTSFAEKVLVKEGAKLYIKAEVFRTDPVMRVISIQDMPQSVIDAVSEQVDAFIAVWSATKSADKQTADTSTPRKAESNQAIGSKAEAKFVASKNSEVFHKPDCQFAARISPQNLVSYDSREEAIGAGKRPCSRCNP